MISELKRLDVSVKNLEVSQYKKILALSSEKLTWFKKYIYYKQAYMHHFCTPNIGLIFEDKQVPKQFSLFVKWLKQFLDHLLFITHTHARTHTK